MTDVPGSDRSLLERLNALKPSTVNLDPSKSVPASNIEPAKPLSREDALTERLKSLRNQSESTRRISTSEIARKDSDTLAPSSPDTSQSPPLPNPKSPGTSVGAPQVSVDEAIDSADSLLFTDDQTLEELLADLESDQQWLDEVAAEEEEHRRVTALLEELGKASSPNPDSDDAKISKVEDDNGDGDNSDDDSEGEHMTREADNVLAKAVDEAEWEKANESPPYQSRPDTPVQNKDASGPDHAADESTAAQSYTKKDPFILPTVPLNLQDQSDLAELSQEDADFAASITSRMAALKVKTPPPRTLPSAPDSDVDAFGLPAAPSFAPADRPAPGLVKRAGYTDEDQKTWCVVCLEDGAIRCVDCDGDVYCARCWREMHVGPSAGYDERGHRWEKFVRGR
ncbi:hypothetical protein F4818DRAFT_418837 [Hypoxylon cercidicola]|nr:hypothetical protein F4818DRAFT_418837 [Hypoxylon cercidicola]